MDVEVEMVRLRAPLGTDEANHGTNRYRVDNDGVIVVPREAVEPLVSVGGFHLIEE